MTPQPGAAQVGETPLRGATRQWSPLALYRPAGLLLLIGLPTCAVLLAVRRWISAAQPLEPALLPAAGLTLALAASLARRLMCIAAPASPTMSKVRLPATTSASLLGFGLALGAAGRPWWSALTYWAIITLEEGWAWSRVIVERNSFRSFLIPTYFRRFHPRTAFRSDDSLPPTAIEPASSASERLTQAYTRVSLGDGQELIRGALHLAVPADARTLAAHVAFCPPFAERPQFDVRLAAGPPCRLKVGQLLPQGVRIEIKLHAPLAVSQRLSLEFTAQGHELVLRDGS